MKDQGEGIRELVLSRYRVSIWKDVRVLGWMVMLA